MLFIFFLQRNHLLNTVCGVISSNSRKICSRTIKCPFHTESQRRDIRLKWMTHAENDETVDIDRSAKFRKEGLALNFNSLFTSVYRQISNQPFFFKICSFTEGDTATLRESLAQLSNASSPAESTISTSSNPSANSSLRGAASSRREGKGWWTTHLRNVRLLFTVNGLKRETTDRNVKTG